MSMRMTGGNIMFFFKKNPPQDLLDEDKNMI